MIRNVLRGTLLVSMISLTATPILAQTTSDGALAEALFQDARRLMAENKFAEACPKLAESARLDRRLGTMLALGICHENEGKLATAWAELTDVLAVARRENRADREKAAQEHIAAIEPRLSRVTFVVSPDVRAIQGLHVTLDGEDVRAAAWGIALPVDPGAHTIGANAPGRRAWSATLSVGSTADSKTVPIPLLDVEKVPTPSALTPVASAPASASAPPTAQKQAPQSAPSDSSDTRRTIGYAVGAVGIVALGVGTIFAIRTASKESSARSLCPQNTCDNMDGVNDNSSARSAYPIGVAGIGLGIVGIAVGAYLAFAPSSDTKTASAPILRGSVDREGASLSLGGAW